VDTQTPEYKRNREEMQALVDEMNKRLRLSLHQGEPKAVQQHLDSGQLLGKRFSSFFFPFPSPLFSLPQSWRHDGLARERIELVLDQDSPFLELMPLAGLGQDGVQVGASIVGGIGLVW